MNTPQENPLEVRRVVLALEGRSAQTHVVEAAVATASAAAAELISVFVEDTELLGAAALPVALEISTGSGSLRPLDAADLEHRLRAEARSAEQQITAAARRAGVSSTFRVTRHSVVAALGELATGNDLLIIAPTLLERRLAAAFAAPASEELVVFDGSEAAGRALQVAALRADREGRQLTVALAGSSATEWRKLIAAEMARFGGHIQPQYITLATSATTELLQLLRTRRPAEVVVPTSPDLLSPHALGALVQALHCTALLVR